MLYVSNNFSVNMLQKTALVRVEQIYRDAAIAMCNQHRDTLQCLTRGEWPCRVVAAGLRVDPSMSSAPIIRLSRDDDLIVCQYQGARDDNMRPEGFRYWHVRLESEE